MPINNGWIKAGAHVAALAVVLGGFDITTFVESQNERQALERAFDQAIFFQLAHALAIVAVGILLALRPGKLLRASAWCFLLGTILFSGSVYLSAFTLMPELAPVKLIGVVILVIAWILLVEGACPGWNKKRATDDGAAEVANSNIGV